MVLRMDILHHISERSGRTVDFTFTVNLDVKFRCREISVLGSSAARASELSFPVLLHVRKSLSVAETLMLNSWSSVLNVSVHFIGHHGVRKGAFHIDRRRGTCYDGEVLFSFEQRLVPCGSFSGRRSGCNAVRTGRKLNRLVQNVLIIICLGSSSFEVALDLDDKRIDISQFRRHCLGADIHLVKVGVSRY